MKHCFLFLFPKKYCIKGKCEICEHCGSQATQLAPQSGLIAVDGLIKDCLPALTNESSELALSWKELFIERRRPERKEAAAEHSQIISLLSLSPTLFHYQSFQKSFCKTANVLQKMKRDGFDLEFNHSSW